MSNRFTPPWTVHHNEDAYWVQDALGHKFGFTYYREEILAGTDPGVRVLKDEARRLVSNFAKLPELLGKVEPPEG